MKKTIAIADSALDQARHMATRVGATVRAPVEKGVRQVTADIRSEASFTLRDASLKGVGLQAGVDEDSWQQPRDLAYGWRGA